MARQIINLGASAGDETGTKARAGGRIINENFEEVYMLLDILSRIDIITENKGFSLVGNDLTINAGWEWIIDNSVYSNPLAFVFEDIALSGSGKIRLVYVVPNDENGFDMLDGEEVTGTPEAPPLPNGGMYVTYFEVTDSVIGTPSDPYNGDSLNGKLDKGAYTGTAQDLANRIGLLENFKKDIGESSYYPVDLIGVVTDLDISTSIGRSLNLTGSVTELHSLYFPSNSLNDYDGLEMYVRNSQETSFLIPHESGNIATENRFIFSFPDAQDLEVLPGQLIHFKLKHVGSTSRGKIEFVGLKGGGDDSNLVHKTGDEEVDGNKSFLQPVTGVEATEPEHLVIKEQMDVALDLKLDAADYNDRFKGVYLTETALNAAHPTANAGDSAQVNQTGSTKVINYSWDAEDGVWVNNGSGGSGATNTDALPEGSSNLYFTTARVLATALTGLSFLTGGAIVSTDSVLVAFGKIQKQLNDGFTGSNIRSLLGITTLSGSNTGDQDLSGYALKSPTIVETGTSFTLDNTYNGKILVLTASCTVTLPNGLASGFGISIVTLASVTLTLAVGGSVTLFNNSGLTMEEKLSCTIQNRAATNQYITAGNL